MNTRRSDPRRPTASSFAERFISGTWTLGGWSDVETVFRVFRVYRIQDLAITAERFGFEPGRTLADFLAAADGLGTGA